MTTAYDLQYTKLDILYIYENKNENENVIHRQIQNLEVNLRIRKIVYFDSSVEDICHAGNNGRLLRHPNRCDMFVECSHGKAYIRQCGPTLHFNSNKGVCDFPYLASCRSGDRKIIMNINDRYK